MGVKDLIEGGMLTWHCEETLNALEEDGEAQGEKENSVDQSTWRERRGGKRSAFGWLERRGKPAERLTEDFCSLPTVRVFGGRGSSSESDSVEGDDEGDDIAEEGEEEEEGGERVEWREGEGRSA